jgi:ADP-ribosylglycohydrolase
MNNKIDTNVYREKVLGCWMGKNIGGALGAPFEWKRQINDVSFYTTELHGSALPNDDLDLQLAWLLALEKHGYALNSQKLSEYWLDFIVPNWVEYGVCKNNMRAGLMPPVSGWFGNVFKDSCGAFIRSEIWACIAPGRPDIAAYFSYQDSSVDHAHEGVYAAMFIAVIQSCAFVESNKYNLIEAGLAAIPEDCETARAVRLVIAAYNSGQDWKTARQKAFDEVRQKPDEYTGLANYSPTGFDVPLNIALIIIGWLYGNDDFGKSICIAVNCGEDTDCTGATLGAILGIIRGIGGIPEVWKEPIGVNIVTRDINRSECLLFPQNIHEMTERCISLGTQMLEHFKDPIAEGRLCETFITSRPWEYYFDFGRLIARLSYEGMPQISNGEIKKMKLSVENNWQYVPISRQSTILIQWLLPEGLSIRPSPRGLISLFTQPQEIDFNITAEETLMEAEYHCTVEIRAAGHPTVCSMPFVLLNGNYNKQPYKVRY